MTFREAYIKSKTDYQLLKSQEGGGKKTYITHDNGGRPFKVEVSLNKIDIYKAKYNDDYKTTTYDELIKSIKSFQKVFIGKNTDIFWCADKKKINDYLGNSILVQLSKYKYIYIGASIFEFTTKDEIIRYESPMGPNDVPYPYGVSEKYTYLMDGDIIRNCEIGYQMVPIHYINGNYCMDDKKKQKSQRHQYKKFTKKVIEKRLL